MLRLYFILMFLIFPAAVRGQFIFTTNNGALSIQNYTGLGGNVVIPSSTNGFPVTSIGAGAFQYCIGLTSVTIPNTITAINSVAFSSCWSLSSVIIPDSVTNLGIALFSDCYVMTNVTIGSRVTSIPNGMFQYCESLTSVTIPSGVTNIGDAAFELCWNLISVTVPDKVTSIGANVFQSCSNLSGVMIGKHVTSLGRAAFFSCGLTNITIPASVTNIGGQAFGYCPKLKGVYFAGNAPSADSTILFGTYAVAYYLPGTAGWAFFATNYGIGTVLWNPLVQTSDTSSGLQSAQFGIHVAGTKNIPIVVETSVDLGNASWTPLQTCTLTNGSIYFSDAAWTNYPNRLYRVRSP
jgi:hypothetical protein